MKTNYGNFLQRDLSWLEFNRRVLEEAGDSRNPLLERITFLGIFGSNLDEFFMKRVGGLKRQLLAEVGDPVSPPPPELLAAIRKTVEPMLARYAECFKTDIAVKLKAEKIHLLRLRDLTKAEKEFASDYFKRNVFPVLTPLAVDPGHPFPFISNLSVSFGVLMRYPDRPDEELFARIKVPAFFPTWLRLTPVDQDAEVRFVSLFEVIGSQLHTLFPGMDIIDIMMFRVSRNADVEKDEEDAEDLLILIAEELKERKFAKVVRLEHGPKPNRKILSILQDELEIGTEDIYELPLCS